MINPIPKVTKEEKESTRKLKEVALPELPPEEKQAQRESWARSGALRKS